MTDLEVIAGRLDYLPEEDSYGVFKWKIAHGQAKKSSFNTKCAGKWAGSIQNDTGYISLIIDDNQLYVHRLSYMFHHNIQYLKDVPDIIDHKDRDTKNNHPSNLRAGVDGVNQRNRGSLGLIKYKGVDGKQTKDGYKYRTRIVVNNREVSLGYYLDLEEAAAIYNAASVYCGFSKENNIGLDVVLPEKYKKKLDEVMSLPRVQSKKSKLLGISWNKKQQKFNTVIWNTVRNFCSGSFEDEVEAGLYRNNFILSNNVVDNHLTYFDYNYNMFTLANGRKVYS